MTMRMRFSDGMVEVYSPFPPYGRVWTLRVPDTGVDKRFEADCRYAAEFHDVASGDYAAAIIDARKARGAAAAPGDDEAAFVGEEP